MSSTVAQQDEVLSPDLQLQEEYAARMAAAGFDYSAVVMGAVVKGMRDLGYRTTATALDELIDNSIQAEATNIDVWVGDGSTTQPQEIAIIDDGHGMSPTMLRLAPVWGAGHHQNDRSGFGKYGYGLGSAGVSQGKRVTVYSRRSGREWYKVYIDLTEIENGNYGLGKPVVVAPAVETEIPPFLKSHLQKHFPGGLDTGTIVVIDKLDKLTWKKTNTLIRHLKQHFGLVYRNYLRMVAISVQGEPVMPIDPLFLTPDAMYFELDGDRAESLPPTTITVKDPDTRQVLGNVRVRFSSMPPGFARVPEDKVKTKGGKTNGRFPVLDENNGIIVCRAGRQIDVVKSKRDKELGIEFAVNNDDRYWGLELDFDPALDEEFAITTSKQHATLSDRMWQLLKEYNVMAAVTDLRKRYDSATARLNKLQNSGTAGPKPAERAMEESDTFVPKPAPTRAAKGKTRLTEEASKRAEAAGVPTEEVLPKVEAEAAQRYKLVVQTMPASAAFYEPEQFGGQTRVLLNENHAFYTRIYSGIATTPEVQQALELLLLTLAEAELNSDGERKLFYEAERSVWSQRLNISIDRLDQIVGREERRED